MKNSKRRHGIVHHDHESQTVGLGGPASSACAECGQFIHTDEAVAIWLDKFDAIFICAECAVERSELFTSDQTVNRRLWE